MRSGESRGGPTRAQHKGERTLRVMLCDNLAESDLGMV